MFPHTKFAEGPLRPSDDYLEKMRAMLNLRLAMTPRSEIGTEAWQQRVQDLARLEAIINHQR